jgi:putative phosphoesterase
MRIGIVSDTHGDVDRLREAMEIFRLHAVGAVVHCGDVGSEACIALLGSSDAEAWLVAGNTDRNIPALAAAAAREGVHFAGDVVEVPLGDGRCLVATHGNDGALLGELIREQKVAYVCHGHTHKRRDDRIGDVRVINPGALFHAKVHTVAVLDTDADTVEHIIVP